MAAFSESTAFAEKGSGVLAGMADSRVIRQTRAEPHFFREHRRSGVTDR